MNGIERIAMEENENKQPGPAETFIRQKFDIKVMPNELTFFHERLFQLMEEFAASQIEESLNRTAPPAEGAEKMLKEGLDDGRYAGITDNINIDIKQPFYQAIIRYAEDFAANQNDDSR